MTVEQLYQKLCSTDFKDTANGDIFYNFFIYRYNAKEEHKMRHEIQDICSKIIRPNHNVDVLAIDLFDTFCDYLDKTEFGKKHPSYLQYLLEKERQGENMVEGVTRSLTSVANSDEFLQYLHKLILDHIIKDDGNVRPYVFLYGIGEIFPYMRVSSLLNRYEKYNSSSEYKIIIFYPGDHTGNTFKLFGLLNDEHTYRAVDLINE